MSTQVNSCIQLIKSHFQMDEADLIVKGSLIDLEKALTPIIRGLLDHDLNRLLNAFYKIDINETTFKEILTQVPSEEIATLLAKEVIHREMQKVETRRQYKNP